MASIRKHGKRWRAEIQKQGIRRSRVFPTRQEAKDWAARAEYEIQNADVLATKAPFGDLLDRYAREVSPGKKGARWEIIRLERLQRDPLAKVQLAELKPSHFADWRDRRLKEVQASSVLREMQLMSGVINRAVKEWGALSSNPLASIQKPRKAQARDRLPTTEEIDRMRFTAGDDLSKATARAFHAFLFALETAMRAGEICGLRWEHIDVETRVARLTHTKNGHPRDVPLSSEAVLLLKALPPDDPVFGLQPRQLDVLFRKVRDRAKVDGLTFHDSRHAAITRLSRKLDVLALARMVGHRDLRMLQTYYNETAADLAKRLD